ncbi:hypothetical protein N0V90_001562 [Kalmusia sp. IMI 367209]|nr:hypothetical protein N0V90_001562 [Kalmusia sp. IMI 367209]
METATLRDLGRDVLFHFAFLLQKGNLQQFDTNDEIEQITESLNTEQERFQLWAANLGVQSTGDRSLDYRIQDRPSVKSYAKQLLEELVEDLSDLCKYLLNGVDYAYIQQLQNNRENSESDLEKDAAREDSNDDASEDDQSDDETTEACSIASESPEEAVSIILEDISDIVDRLYRLAAKLRSSKNRAPPSAGNFYREPLNGEDGESYMNSNERQIAKAQTEEFHTRRIQEIVRQFRRDASGDPYPREDRTPELDIHTKAVIRRIAIGNAYRQQQFAFWRQREWDRRNAISNQFTTMPIRRKQDPQERPAKKAVEQEGLDTPIKGKVAFSELAPKPQSGCPLCSYEAQVWADMDKHLAGHLESFALLSLPLATGLERDEVSIKSDQQEGDLEDAMQLLDGDAAGTLASLFKTEEELVDQDGTQLPQGEKIMLTALRELKTGDFVSANAQTTGSSAKDLPGRGYMVTYLRTLMGHSHGVNAVVFSPDGDMLASASGDKTIKLWNPRGATLQTLEGHQDLINSIAFSGDGKQLASASGDKTVKLWDVASGAVLQTLKGHSSWIGAVAFSPAGNLLASGSGDMTVKFWDPNTGALLQTLHSHSNWIDAIAFSSSGRLLVSASGDTKIKLWDVSSGKVIQTLEGHTHGVNAVAFSPGSTQERYYRLFKAINMGSILWPSHRMVKY